MICIKNFSLNKSYVTSRVHLDQPRQKENNNLW